MTASDWNSGKDLMPSDIHVEEVKLPNGNSVWHAYLGFIPYKDHTASTAWKGMKFVYAANSERENAIADLIDECIRELNEVRKVLITKPRTSL